MKSFRTWVLHIFSSAFNLAILNKKRLQWVDYLRGIAIILVVYRHTLAGIQRSGINVPQFAEDANMIFFSFRIPLFFILSGIFIDYSLRKKKLGQLVLDKFELLIYPYLIWSVIQISMQILLGRFTNSHRGLIDYAYIFYQPRNLDQFWYLPALFNATMLYLFLKTKLKLSVNIQLVLGLVLYFLYPYAQNISMISDCMEFYVFFTLGNFISDFFFQPKTQQFLKRGYTVMASIPIFVVAQIYYLLHIKTINNTADPLSNAQFFLLALLGCFCMFILAFKLQEWKLFSFLRILGYHSLYIYVTHVLILAVIRFCLTKFLGIYNPIILLIIGIFLGVTIPIIFYNLAVKNKALWFLFTFRKKKRTKTESEQPLHVITVLPTSVS